MNEVLPIGSIIYLKEGQQKLMIWSRGCQWEQDNELVFFGHSGAADPVGLNPEQIFYFNQEDIDKVVFHGYTDLDEERFVELYKKWFEENKANLKIGKTH